MTNNRSVSGPGMILTSIMASWCENDETSPNLDLQVHFISDYPGTLATPQSW